MRFHFYGHPNITARHKKTLEITKDAEISKRADCIIGVKADYIHEKLLNLNGSYELIISDGHQEETVSFTANPGFKDEEEIVIRLSGFISDRTLGIKSDKAASDLKMLGLDDPKKRFEAVIREKAA